MSNLHLTDPLKWFFNCELENYRTAVRQGDIDPSGGFHPTLATALDSWDQAPVEVRAGWLGIDEGDLRIIRRHADGVQTTPEVNAWEAMHDAMQNLAWLIVVNGPDALLLTLLEESA